MVKVGIFGANPKGERHIQQITGIPEFDLIGIYDPDYNAAKLASDRYKIPFFTTPDALINGCDAIDFELSPDIYFDLLTRILTRSKHVLVDYPVSLTLEKIIQLNKLSREADVIIQVSGHDRLNPAFQAVIPHLKKPMFIEIRRCRISRQEINNEDFLKKILVRDIDLVLYLSKSNVQRINATGIHIVHDPTDLINARLEFDNGCVSNITWNNYSETTGCECLIFQKNQWFRLDLEKNFILNHKVKDFAANSETQPADLRISEVAEEVEIYPSPEDHNKELVIFRDSILHKTPPLVDIDEAFFAVKTLLELFEKISKKT